MTHGGRFIHFFSVIFIAAFILSGAWQVYAGWSEPVKISEDYAYSPRIAYGHGVLHALYFRVENSRITYTRSTDLGQTWTPGFIILDTWGCYPHLAASGDSVVAIWTGDARFGDYNYIVAKSSDCGASWGDTSLILPSGISGARCNFCLSGPNIHLVFRSSGRELYYKNSTNWGESWNNTQTLGSYDQLDGLQIKSFGHSIFVAFGGEVDYHNPTEAYFVRSMNGGQSWELPVMLSAEDEHSSYNPWIAVNERGLIAVGWSDYGYLSYRISRDFGASWESADTIDERRTGRMGGLEWRGDSIHVVWEAGRIMHAISTDGGDSWRDPDTVEQNRYSSYDPAIALSPDMVHVVWDERRAHNPGIYYSRNDSVSSPAPNDSTVLDLEIIGHCRIPSTFDFWASISIGGHYAYICGFGEGSGHPALGIIDITNPFEPTIVTLFDTTSFVSDITTWGNYLFVARPISQCGLTIFDVSDVSNPVQVYQDPENRDSEALAYCNNRIYYGQDGRITIYNVTNPLSPQIAGTYNPSPREDYVGLFANNSILYAVGRRELHILNVSNPASPFLLGIYALEFGGTEQSDIVISGHYAYVCRFSPEIYVLNVENPSYPWQANVLNLDWGGARHFFIEDKLLYVAHNDISVFDFFDQPGMTLMADYNGPLSFDDIAADRQYLYAIGDTTFAVMPISELVDIEETIPTLRRNDAITLGSFPNPFNGQSVIIVEGASEAEIAIYDIAGRRVATLSASSGLAVWNPTGVSSGIFLVRAIGDQKSNTLKIIYLK